VVQILGAFTATVLLRWLLPSIPTEAKEVVPHVHAGRG
jgi:glycerol uptake facilitator-like aquaporin